MPDFKTSYNGLLFLAENEGVVLCPYKDSVGVWTIGVGHTKAAGDPDPAKCGNMTLEEALQLFELDIVDYEVGVNKALTYEKATQYQFDAAVSFHYNTGAISTANWVDAWNAGRLDEAAAEIMNWTTPPEVTDRRKREQKLFASGNYSEPFIISVWETTFPGPVKAVTVPGEDEAPPPVTPPVAAEDVCKICGEPLPSFCSNCGTALPA